MEDFVSFELANKLKEKGFNEGCYKYYEGKELKWPNSPWLKPRYNDYLSHITAAPTISQVLKWMRDKKKIHICIDIYDDGWFFDIASFYKDDTGVYEIKLPYKSSKVTPDYDSFEQAALAGIEYSLDNLI